jgi:hypothetical protein
VAYKAGTETPVTEAVLFTPLPQPLDLYITRGAAIDSGGRLIIVPKRVPVRLDLASVPSVLDAGMYRLELLYQAEESGRGGRNGSSCEADLPGVLEEGYRLRLTEYDPSDPLPELDLGAVLDGPVDDPRVPAPIVLGLVEWSGTAYDGYSTGIRRYASVRAQRVRAPDDRSEVELRDRNNRFTVRFAAPPGADPFTPGEMEDRFRIESDGDVWVPTEISVGLDGVQFRREGDPNNPENSNWRIHTTTSEPGANFGFDSKGDPLAANKYAEGSRELRVLFQREGGNTGRNRVVIGHVGDNATDFKPALVVYDLPRQGEGTGDATVEVWGDLYVHGTAVLNAVARRPKVPATGVDDLNLLLRQLAGPYAAAFRVFLTSDPVWLKEFGDVVADQIASDAATRTTVVNAIKAQLATALLADSSFTDVLRDTAVAAVRDATNLPLLVSALTTLLDDPAANVATLPVDQTRRLVAAIYRRLLANFTVSNNEISNSAQAGMTAKMQAAVNWLTV